VLLLLLRNVWHCMEIYCMYFRPSLSTAKTGTYAVAVLSFCPFGMAVVILGLSISVFWLNLYSEVSAKWKHKLVRPSHFGQKGLILYLKASIVTFVSLANTNKYSAESEELYECLECFQTALFMNADINGRKRHLSTCNHPTSQCRENHHRG